MKEMVKYCIRVFCCVAMSYGLMSCNDDELLEDTGNGGTDEEVSYEPTVEDLQFKAMQQIINNLCDVDTVNGQAVYDFKIGQVLDETMPTEYSVGCETLEEAINLFRYSILGADNEPEDMNGVLDLDLGDYGKLTFSPGGDNGALATLTVRLEELPLLTKLYFIPETLWPDNYSSPFQRGDIVYDKTEGRMYVCIADYNAGRDGILFTLDGGWNLKGKKHNFYVCQEVPRESDFNALYEYYTDNRIDFMTSFLLAFRYFYTSHGWNNAVDQDATSVYSYDFESVPDLQNKDAKRDDFERKMKGVGFHEHSEWRKILWWYYIWYYGYKLEKGERYGKKFQWSEGSTFGQVAISSGPYPANLILSHVQYFGPSVERDRYDIKY